MLKYPTALLITGSEERHQHKIIALQEHLESIKIPTTQLTNPTEKVFLATLKTILSQTHEQSPVLICFYGHGHVKGWESSGWKCISYKKIVATCRQFPHFIQFINSTCYGHFLIKEFIGKRSGMRTGVICDWEGYTECYGTAMTDVLRSWPQGLKPEDVISEDVYCPHDTPVDLHFMPIFRWGAIFDRYFFQEAT